MIDDDRIYKGVYEGKLCVARKLTPSECLKLMGFEKCDHQAMREVGMSDSAIYHCSGDSIVTTCLMALLGQMLPISEKELKQKIEDYVKSIVES